MIQTNYGLQQPEAAEGILEFGKKRNMLSDTEDWFQKLQKWPEALVIYEKTAINEQNFIKVTEGKLNCYRNLMEWDKFSGLIDGLWNDHIRTTSQTIKHQTKEAVMKHASDAAYSAWNLGKWEDFKRYTKYLDNGTYPRYFYSAILNIQQGGKKSLQEAIKNIDLARDTLS